MTLYGTIPKYLLNIAGEYRVCSELAKRGIFATITAGNRKSVDLYAINDLRKEAVKIEVKTSQKGNFVTGIGQKGLAGNPSAADFWVLFQVKPGPSGTFAERFFILTHAEICEIQQRHNQASNAKYLATHGRQYPPDKGVDNVTVDAVSHHEGKWEKIIDAVGASAE
jgi:hypothetical protein